MMNTVSFLADAALGFLGGAVIGPFLAQQTMAPEIGLDSLLRYGPAGAVIAVVWLFMRDNRARDDKQAEIAKAATEAVFKEREQSANERKHSMDRVNEITATFSKTVLDIVARNKP